MKNLKLIRLLSLMGWIVSIFLAMGVPFIGIPLLIVTFFTWIWSRSKLKRLCLKCGASLHGAEYSYEEVDKTEMKNGDQNTVVEFTSVCPSCGENKSFKHSYQSYLSGYDNLGQRKTRSAKSINIKRLVEKDAKKYFGH